MTKKVEKIVKTYEEKLDMQVFIFRENICDLETVLKNIREERAMFQNMLSSMFLYYLISKADYEELVYIPCNLADNAREKCWEIKRERESQDEVA